MRALLILAALTLSACASQPEQAPLAGKATGFDPIVVGTLATNPCEARVAPTYTAATVLAERTSRAVRDGRLAPDTAQKILDLGRAARADLDAACVNGVLDASRLAAAESAVSGMQNILGGTR